MTLQMPNAKCPASKQRPVMFTQGNAVEVACLSGRRRRIWKSSNMIMLDHLILQDVNDGMEGTENFLFFLQM